MVADSTRSPQIIKLFYLRSSICVSCSCRYFLVKGFHLSVGLSSWIFALVQQNGMTCFWKMPWFWHILVYSGTTPVFSIFHSNWKCLSQFWISCLPYSISFLAIQGEKYLQMKIHLCQWRPRKTFLKEEFFELGFYPVPGRWLSGPFSEKHK